MNSSPVEPVADTEAVETANIRQTVWREGVRIRRTDGTGYADFVSDDDIRANIGRHADGLHDPFGRAVLAMRAFERASVGIPFVPSSSTREDGETQTLAELHARYLATRQHTLSTDGMDRDDAIEAQALYVLGEASELHMACKGGAPWGPQRNQREEIADVVLAAVSLANILGVTVENCITEKTESDRGRG